MGLKHPRKGVNVGSAHFTKHVSTMQSHECHQILVFQQHILLQDLNVGLWLAQSIYPLNQEVP